MQTGLQFTQQTYYSSPYGKIAAVEHLYWFVLEIDHASNCTLIQKTDLHNKNLTKN